MSKVFTAAEVKKHNTNRSVWIVIRNDVYDVTAFVEQHPGGEDPLLEAAGQDATIAFDDVGHSASARGMLKKYKIGTLAPGEGCRSPSTKSMKSNHKDPVSPRAERRVKQIVVPIDHSQSTSREKMKPPVVQPPVQPPVSPTCPLQTPPVPEGCKECPLCFEQPPEPCPGCPICAQPTVEPGSPSYLKWALLALGFAIIIGIALKKYSS